MSYRLSSSQNQAARLLEGWRCTPGEVANDAIAWFDTLSQADADSAIDRLIDRIIKILRNAVPHSGRDPGHVGFAPAKFPNSDREDPKAQVRQARSISTASSIFSVPTLEAFRAARRPPERHSGHI